MENKQVQKEKITVEYARKVLGNKSKRLTDKEIQGILHTLTLVCEKSIENIINKANL